MEKIACTLLREKVIGSSAYSRVGGGALARERLQEGRLLGRLRKRHIPVIHVLYSIIEIMAVHIKYVPVYTVHVCSSFYFSKHVLCINFTNLLNQLDGHYE